MFGSFRNGLKGRIFGKTTAFCEGASWVEGAAGRRGEDAGHLAFECLPGGLPVRSNLGNRGHQGGGIRMKGFVVKFADGRLLNDFTHIHHGDGIAGELDDGEVVCNEQVGEREFLLEVFEEIKDLGLDGDVEGTDWFVADDEFRLKDKGSGDADSLSLAA